MEILRQSPLRSMGSIWLRVLESGKSDLASKWNTSPQDLLHHTLIGADLERKIYLKKERGFKSKNRSPPPINAQTAAHTPKPWVMKEYKLKGADGLNSLEAPRSHARQAISENKKLGLRSLMHHQQDGCGKNGIIEFLHWAGLTARSMGMVFHTRALLWRPYYSRTIRLNYNFKSATCIWMKGQPPSGSRRQLLLLSIDKSLVLELDLNLTLPFNIYEPNRPIWCGHAPDESGNPV